MMFTTLRSVLFIAQLLIVAVLAVPTAMPDIAIEGRSLQARAPVIKFHVCTAPNYSGDCFHVDTNPLTTPGSSSECMKFKPGVAGKIQSVRVLDTWNYLLEIHSDEYCSDEGQSIIDSEKDLGDWNDKVKSVRVFYLPIPYDSYPNNAV